MQSLADFLGTRQPEPDFQAASAAPCLEDIAGDATAFCQAVLNSREFRTYIVNGLNEGNIPAAVMLRVMDHAGWQKPPERHEHTGKDGDPIVTEVRRVIVHVTDPDLESLVADKPLTTH